MVLKTLLLLLALLAGMESASCQQAAHPRWSHTQRRLLRQIARHKRMESEFISRVGAPSAQYARFDSLRRISSKADLVAFARHPSPVVRAYAFRALLRQHDAPNAFAVLRTSLQDTAVFSHQFGCIGGACTVRLFMLVNFRNAAKSGQISPADVQWHQAEEFYDQLPDREVEEKIVARYLRTTE